MSNQLLVSFCACYTFLPLNIPFYHDFPPPVLVPHIELSPPFLGSLRSIFYHMSYLVVGKSKTAQVWTPPTLAEAQLPVSVFSLHGPYFNQLVSLFMQSVRP